MQRYIGIDLGGTNIKGALVSETGKILKQRSVPTHAEAGAEAVTKTIAAMICALAEGESVSGVGMGCPGTVDDQEGTVVYACNLGWVHYDVRTALRELTGYSVRLVNDANAAAMGEAWLGSAKGVQNVVMVTIGTGVGGGVIVNGDVVSGVVGAGGEIGHMCLNPAEEHTCGCGGHGHLEQYSSATGVVSNYLAECKKAGVEPIELTGPSDSKDVFQACREGDKLALAAADTMADYLGRALALIANVVDPEMFLIGGGASASVDVYLDAVREHFQRYALSASRETPIKVASLGNDAGIIGAAYVALRAAGK